MNDSPSPGINRITNSVSDSVCMCCGDTVPRRRSSTTKSDCHSHARRTQEATNQHSARSIASTPHRISAQVHVRASVEQRRRQSLGHPTSHNKSLLALESACTECAKWSFNHASQHLAELRAWETNARNVLAQRQIQDVCPAPTQLELANTVRNLQMKHANALAHLHRIEPEIKAVQNQLHTLQNDEATICQQEQELHTQLRSRSFAQYEFEERQISLLGRIAQSQHCIQNLKPTNPFNDAFHIWHSGPFGTINKLRLGHLVVPKTPSITISPIKTRARSNTIAVSGSGDNTNATTSPTHGLLHVRRQSTTDTINVKQTSKAPKSVVGSGGDSEETDVTWDEMNNAWGQAALLLCAIARTARYSFKAYSIDPLGSRSRVTPFMRPTTLQSASSSAASARVRDTSASMPLFFLGETSRAGGAGVGSAGLLMDQLMLGFRGRGQVSPLAEFNKAMTGFMMCLIEVSDVAVADACGVALKLKEKLYQIMIKADRKKASVASSGNGSIGSSSGNVMQIVVHINGQPVAIDDPMNVLQMKKWTEAMKFTLSNLKWLLVWAVKQMGS